MRFLADECVWRDVVDAICERGFECRWVHDVSPSISDREVLNLSVSEKLLLVSEDADYGELIFHRNLEAYGIVRVLLSRFGGKKKEVAALVASRIAEIADTLPGRFTTIDPDRTRQRPLPGRSKAED
jgi:predicted nuclease of predicted toxin-antitoxin system